MNEQVYWYVARATGIVAWSLLSMAVLWGVLLSTRLVAQRATPAWLLDLHRFLGGLSVIFVGLHLAGLVADSYVHFGLADLLVPFASDWRPVAVGWGVVAFHLLLAVELTSLARKRIPARLWRRVHASSFVLWVLATMHTVSAGTDTGNALVQWLVLLLVLGVLYTGVVRALSPKPDRKPRPTMVAARSDEGP